LILCTAAARRRLSALSSAPNCSGDFFIAIPVIEGPLDSEAVPTMFLGLASRRQRFFV
jgi:hypothetical protein